MAVVRKKQDDKYLLALRELVASGSGGNRQCFDCGQKGPTYVNMTIGSFVCTRCSGVLRGLTPPHRVKSISMATFTQDEIDFLRTHGNELCAKTWLGLWDPKRAVHQQEQRELMMDKYERKRYYLEPASPLKSLANAVNLKSSVPVTNHIQNGHHNGYASIHLTPPAAQRTSANGLQKMGNSSSNSSSVNSSSSISRPHHHHHHHNNNSQNNNHDAFGLTGGLSSLNSAGSTSTGALSDTSSCASNGFGADSDFVADFGSANIFDATSARSTGSPAVSSVSSVGSSNGYAKVQPLRAAHLQQQQQQLQQQLLNGNGNGHQGAENFADFDHAPIFNAVAPPTFHDWISDWSRRGFHDPFDDCDESPPGPAPPVPVPAQVPAVSSPLPTVQEEPELAWNFWQEEMRIEEQDEESQPSQQQELSYSFFNSTPPLSPSNPFLPYLSNEEQHPHPPEKPSYSYLLFSSISNSSQEEPQVEDHEMDILNANFHDFFTWSAPLQNGHATSPPKGGSAAMAPSEDRYAALKDLDEQLRELKASESAPEAPTPTNGNGQATDAFGALNNNPNPFKGQQQLSSHVVNPFQQQQQQQQQNLYGQLTLIPNAYGSSPQQQMGHHLLQQQQHQQQSFFNFNNNGFAVSQGLPNGCGFGSMQPAPVMANNPFAASGAMNTNNPFL
ncbi:TPR-containing protein DDB_G0280363 isoform X2 [Drosophila subpulchrella]|uniref:TPR-containing protein DDB_G0280363 isoform X2 n=2 Tax=Drosophila subpulchrella TaxID=1486046 RepID=UPI0018A18584|nr:TPR-containing protein DDB_G0280363 isoform X2 [Drosophila subpulchrella]